MLFNTIDYFIFFIIVFGVNYILPSKIRYIWLLIASYYFYMQWNPWYACLILGTTIITYVSGLAIDKRKDEFRRKIINNCILNILFSYFTGDTGIFQVL